MARSRRRHRLDAPSVLLRREQRGGPGAPAVRPGRVRRQDRALPRDLTRRPTCSSWSAVAPPMAVRQHAAVPRRQAPVYDANWLNEGASSASPLQADGNEEALVAHPARQARLRLRPTRSATSARPLDHVPDHHATARGRPAIVPISAIFASRRCRSGAVRRYGAHAPCAIMRPSDQRVALVGTARVARFRPGPRQLARSRTRSGVHRPGPSSGSRTATSTGCLREVTLETLHLPGTPPTASWTSCSWWASRGARSPPTTSLARPFHTMEGPLHLVPLRIAGMEQVPLDKFLFTVDRDPEALRALPRGRVPTAWSPGGRRPRRTASSTPQTAGRWPPSPTPARGALVGHDHMTLSEMGAPVPAP